MSEEVDSDKEWLMVQRHAKLVAELKKENENLSASIKGMASGKVNLNKSYQDLEGLYDRLEKTNAALVKRWESLKADIQLTVDNYGGYSDIDTSVAKKVLETMEELQAGSK